MGFLSLLEVASMPVLQFLLIGLLGAFLASGYSNILSPNARRDINKVVFVVFTPSMVFVSLAKTVNLQEIISWWFMPVNVMISFLIGGSLAWIMLKIVRVEPHLENLIIATCSAGNVGNMLLIIVPAICHEDNNPFGEESVCHYRALSYVSLSMALGEVYVWTHSYSLMRKSGVLYDKIRYGDSSCEILSIDSEVSEEALRYQSSLKPTTDVTSSENTLPLLSRNNLNDDKASIWGKLKQNLQQFAKELLAPSTIAAVLSIFIYQDNELYMLRPLWTLHSCYMGFCVIWSNWYKSRPTCFQNFSCLWKLDLYSSRNVASLAVNRSFNQTLSGPFIASDRS